MSKPEIHPFASVRPVQTLDLLSQREMASLASADREIHRLFRYCALAVLNTGGQNDDAREIVERHADFEVEVVPEARGLRLEVHNAPAQAFVDGRMIQGIRQHLFTALRDIVFTHQKLAAPSAFDLASSEGITDAVFRILRNADVVRANTSPRLVVCWGGHSISRQEYDYSKEVGYQMGLRELDIATGCGPGAMKGPMKGATIGHAKQFRRDSRYVGISEPGIIAAESPNPIVNELVILPDIEKRLEAFVRMGHAIVVFPGGAGTLEEILFLLGIKMHPDNAGIPLPLVMTAPASSGDYFEKIDEFLTGVLGESVRQHYEIIPDDPARVARTVKAGVREVREFRRAGEESFGFNWGLHIAPELQQPFEPTHETMAALPLSALRPQHELVANLRRAFSGIVAGNVKEAGVRAVESRGPYQLRGDEELVASLGSLLDSFVEQGRMKLDSASYTPCFVCTTATD